VFGRRAKREAEELRRKYGELEDKYEDLSADHDRLKEETGERTTMRISRIEEEIESMNARVDKLATDSYAIHSELRDIKDSVTEMHTSLKEIVQLYKAILTQYGTAQMRAQARERLARARRPGESPGDAVIRELKAEQDRSAARDATRREPPRRTPEEGLAAAQPRASPRSASPQAQSPAPRQPAPTTTAAAPSALDELHRVEAEDRERRGTEEAPAERGADRVDRVARRDMDRAAPIRGGVEEGFLRPLPRKQVQRRATPEGSPTSGDGWEETAEPAPNDEGGARGDDAE
jgi:archaellum component FlaC